MSGKRKRGLSDADQPPSPSDDDLEDSTDSPSSSPQEDGRGFFDHKFIMIQIMTAQTTRGKPHQSINQVLTANSWNAEDVEMCILDEWMALEDDKAFIDLAGKCLKLRLNTGVPVFRRPLQTLSLRQVLRDCQEVSLRQAALAFQSARDRMLIVLPTGVGKTLVMAFAPFICQAKRVLIITPNVTLAAQHRQKLPAIFGQKNVLRVLPISSAKDVIVDNRLEPSALEPDISITNSQNLLLRERKSDDQSREKVLRPQVLQYIKRANPDLILVDEGHHFPQESIKMLLNALQQTDVSVKIILLTATPCRGDGLRYDLDSEDQVFMFTRAEAVKQGYIKRVSAKFVPVECPDNRREWAIHFPYLDPLLQEAAKQLIEMRQKCGGFPHRALVLMNEKACCEKGAARFNELSAESKWKLKAGFLTSDNRQAGDFTVTEEMFSTIKPEDPKIDFLFQCGTLGEGYDNSAIGMCVLVNIPSVLSKLSQFIGRSMRIPQSMEDYIAQIDANKDMARDTFKTARVVMPDLPQMKERFDDFHNAVDEDISGIFTEGQSNGDFKLGNYHRVWTRENSKWLLKTVTSNGVLDKYHDAYKIARGDWKIIPAQVLGKLVARKLIASDVRILDIGYS